MTLAEKLVLLLKQQGLSQAELARMVGVHPSRVSDWCAGKGNPSIKQGFKIATLFNVSLDYLANDLLVQPIPQSQPPLLKRIIEISNDLGHDIAWRRLIKADEVQNRIGAVDAGPDADAPARRGSA